MRQCTELTQSWRPLAVVAQACPVRSWFIVAWHTANVTDFVACRCCHGESWNTSMYHVCTLQKLCWGLLEKGVKIRFPVSDYWRPRAMVWAEKDDQLRRRNKTRFAGDARDSIPNLRSPDFDSRRAWRSSSGRWVACRRAPCRLANHGRRSARISLCLCWTVWLGGSETWTGLFTLMSYQVHEKQGTVCLGVNVNYLPR
jgi:hypothetical protein